MDSFKRLDLSLKFDIAELRVFVWSYQTSSKSNDNCLLIISEYWLYLEKFKTYALRCHRKLWKRRGFEKVKNEVDLVLENKDVLCSLIKETVTENIDQAKAFFHGDYDYDRHLSYFLEHITPDSLTDWQDAARNDIKMFTAYK